MSIEPIVDQLRQAPSTKVPLSERRVVDSFVAWFRESSPYIHAHRGHTFVITFGGEAVEDPGFANLIHDLALLHGLGIRLVLVPGARPQIEARLRMRRTRMRYVEGVRITDKTALACVKEAAGAVRVEIEALLSMGLANSPMAGARIRVASGNFVTAQPLGVLNGVDYQHTGKVRRIDLEAIRQRLDSGAVALIPPLGYSPTGEVFNLTAADVASSAAIVLGADKLICLMEGPGLVNEQGELVTNATVADADLIVASEQKLPEDLDQYLRAGLEACRGGIKRIHLLSRKIDGALLHELFTRDGMGTLLTSEPFEETRQAHIYDVGGILELLSPLEQQGVLVRRSRKRLETEIDRFFVMERDGMVIACAALYCYPQEHMAELACLAVHPEYRKQGRGDKLLAYMEEVATQRGIAQVFVLTTQTSHWFLERGFNRSNLQALPMQKKTLYNYQRNAKVFINSL